jgi:Fe-S-cluster containining protein
MVDGAAGDEEPLAAGAFSAWLARFREALGGGRDMDVPCGTCTACCASSQFVHIGPDEVATLAHIPAELLFPAPGRPRGHVLLGYDERGRCPMLGEGGCTIYEHRPRTCRTYDCRVFAAAGLEGGGAVADLGAEKPLVARRARRWRFTFPTAEDRARRDAVEAAAAAVRRHADRAGPGAVTPHATGRVVLAAELHELFLAEEPGGRLVVADPGPAAVAVALRRRGEPRRAS